MNISPIKISHDEFKIYKNFIEKKIGIKFPETKKSLLESRLSSHISRIGLNSFSEYYNYFKTAPQDEYDFFIDKITTHTTNFFRESIHFKYLINNGIKIINDEFNNPLIKILSIGTSTGEEMYSLALIFAEQKKFNKLFDYGISGIDISKNALLKAKKGIFKKDSINYIPKKYRAYFNLMDDKIEAKDILKNNLRFFILNVSKSNQIFPDTYHIIFCRNTLIYFSNSLQQNIINNISNILIPGGLLFIGLSESLQGLNHSFKKQESTIYRSLK